MTSAASQLPLVLLLVLLASPFVIKGEKHASRTLTQTHTATLAESITQENEKRKSHTLSHSMSVEPGQHRHTRTKMHTPSRWKTQTLAETITQENEKRKSHTLSHSMSVEPGQHHHTRTKTVVPNHYAAPNDDGASEAMAKRLRTGISLVAALVVLGGCGTLLMWHRKRSQQKHFHDDSESGLLHPGFVTGNHTEFVGPARQEELTSVRSGRDDVIAAAESINADGDYLPV